MEDYCLSGLTGVAYTNSFWSAYGHFYGYPGYVISYSVSALSAIQICRMEAEEPGVGVEAFCRLLDRTHGKKFIAVMEEAGLENPFERDVLEKTAVFLKKVYEMN